MPLRPLPCLLVPALLAAAPPEAMSPARRQLHLASFDQVWTTVQTRHWDPALGGLDWAKVRAELRPRVEKAATDDDAFARSIDPKWGGELPALVLYDKTGKKVKIWKGETSTAEIEAAVAKLL